MERPESTTGNHWVSTEGLQAELLASQDRQIAMGKTLHDMEAERAVLRIRVEEQEADRCESCCESKYNVCFSRIIVGFTSPSSLLDILSLQAHIGYSARTQKGFLDGRDAALAPRRTAAHAFPEPAGGCGKVTDAGFRWTCIVSAEGLSNVR